VSRAFIKEDQMETGSVEPVAERLPSGRTNYATPSGLAALARAVEVLEQRRREAEAIPDEEERTAELAHIDRELRYAQARRDSAVAVDPSHLPADRVHFGSKVTVADAEGHQSTYVIVGEDEADPHQGWISWASPLAQALINGEVGETVTFTRPSGRTSLEIVAVENATFEGGPAKS
jgi:transcription elongation factor GreB